MTVQIGQVFGRWTVTGEAPPRGRNKHAWCRCNCGTVKSVFIGNLQQGYSTNCGCTRYETSRLKHITHGMRHTPEYGIWCAIKTRCYNPRATRSFVNHGGRGVTVSEAWLNSFETFLADMGPRPSGNMSIERVDNDGPYSKENCVWATANIQARNKRSSRKLTFSGRTKTITDWSRDLGGGHALIAKRLKRGWPIERALTEPSQRER